MTDIHSVIPSPATKTTAERMIRTAVDSTGFDAAIQHLADVHPRQVAALVALLADAAAQQRGTPTKKAEKQARGQAWRDRIAAEEAAYTDEEAKRAHAQYRQGARTPWAIAGDRVYSRRKARRYKARDRQLRLAEAS